MVAETVAATGQQWWGAMGNDQAAAPAVRTQPPPGAYS